MEAVFSLSWTDSLPYGQALQTECAMSADDMVVHGGVDMLSKVLYARGRCDIGQVCIMPLCFTV